METARGFLTVYTASSGQYASYVLCNSLFEADKIIKERNLGEEIISEFQEIKVIPDYKNLDNCQFIEMLPEILHTTSFISYIALRSKRVTVDEILGDDGILHELTHLIAKTIPIEEDSLCEIRSKLSVLQQCAVGLFN